MFNQNKGGIMIIPFESLIIIVLGIAVAVYVVIKFFDSFKSVEKLKEENARYALNNDLRMFKTEIVNEVAALIPSNNSITEPVKKGVITKSVFSEYELKIGAFIVTGKTSKAVAEEMQITPYMVNNQIEAMRKKCGANNRAELVAYLIENELV